MADAVTPLLSPASLASPSLSVLPVPDARAGPGFPLASLPSFGPWASLLPESPRKTLMHELYAAEPGGRPGPYRAR